MLKDLPFFFSFRLCSYLHILTCMHTYTPTDPSFPPHCLAWHQFPLTQMVMGERDTKRDQTQREWQQLISTSFYQLCSPLSLRPYMFSHKSHGPVPYIYPSTIHPSFTVPQLPQFITPRLHISISAPYGLLIPS